MAQDPLGELAGGDDFHAALARVRQHPAHDREALVVHAAHERVDHDGNDAALGVQQFESYITIPVVMSRTVKLHPAVIAIGVIVVGQLFGAVGLIVSVPILAAIVILVDELWVKPMEARALADAAQSVEHEPRAEVRGGVDI